MAYLEIYREVLQEFSQEELFDDKGNRIQQYFKAEVELIVSQELINNENRSEFKVELVANVENGSGNKITFRYNPTNSLLVFNGQYYKYGNDNTSLDKRIDINIKENETIKGIPIVSFSTFNDGRYVYRYVGGNRLDSKELKVYHSFNGDCPITKIHGWYEFLLRDLDNGVTYARADYEEFDINIIPYSTDRASYATTAASITDEENPSFTYSIKPNYCYSGDLVKYDYQDKIVSALATVSLDGETPLFEYRNIPIDTMEYTFVLTDAERDYLLKMAQGSAHVPIYYLIKTNRSLEELNQAAMYVGATQRTLTIIGATPTLNPTVKDIQPETLALTGNENIFVRYESMVEFSTGAVASKNAEIVSQSVQCGSKVVNNLYNGIIDDIESDSFIFNATDSRGLNANQVVITNTAMIQYVKPTVKQELNIEMSGETGAAITLKVSGNYFNGSFGAASNTIQLYVRYASGNEELGEWQSISGTPTFKDNTYELTTTISGLSYSQSYTFQCRITDKLNTAETAQYTIKLLPVFDWSENDFNFNVPVNINAELSMNNETIIRHNKTANNTVISATGGYIYLRPGGTNDTTGETIIYPDGSIKFGGSVDLSDALTDYVVEIGETPMGSNGTWYWRKWASGRAEAAGCRNFGNMAVTTAWGNLYRSEILSQELPDDVFSTTPDSININIVNAGFGGWICKHEQTAPSAVTTGSFIFVRPASATVTPTLIGFYIVGQWR